MSWNIYLVKAWFCIFDYGDAVALDCREHVYVKVV